MFFLYLLAGAIGGVFGGMGMGGGTLLIPLLTIFFSVEQKTAQAINLISFIPMALMALRIHLKNKLVDFKGILYIIVPAVAFGILGSLIAKKIGSGVLHRCFGAFLILLAAFQLYTFIKDCKNKK